MHNVKVIEENSEQNFDICLSVYLSICPSVCLCFPTVCLSVRMNTLISETMIARDTKFAINMCYNSTQINLVLEFDHALFRPH